MGRGMGTPFLAGGQPPKAQVGSGAASPVAGVSLHDSSQRCPQGNQTLACGRKDSSSVLAQG